MNPITAHPVSSYPLAPASSRRAGLSRLAVTLLLGVALGAMLTVAVVAAPRSSGTTTPAAGVAVTDGWAHSPVTRLGANDARAALLRLLAASYAAQGPAAEARSR